MSKSYHVEIQFSKKTWTTIERCVKQVDALHYVKTHVDSYPVRIVRVVKTIVFEGK